MPDLKCPFCGNENTTRVPNEIFDASVKSTWWMIVIFGILGISINPIILLLAIATMIFNIIINILVKIRCSNVWVMQCPRCKKEFTIPNPDKKEKIQKNIEKSNAREQVRAEKNELKREKHLEKSRKETANIEKNSELFENETLVSEIDYFATHKNAWSSVAGMLRITDKSLLIYNKKGAFRIYKEQVVKIRKKNYFFIVPTGVQICIYDGKRKHKYNFVVMMDKRKQILDKLYLWVG
ncbi:MAG: hypothetical protein IJA32_12590 [Lachnospiraceae bacterium]|nr:hypothetical protein [Lachnospiraceae bacterium]